MIVKKKKQQSRKGSINTSKLSEKQRKVQMHYFTREKANNKRLREG